MPPLAALMKIWAFGLELQFSSRLRNVIRVPPIAWIPSWCAPADWAWQRM